MPWCVSIKIFAASDLHVEFGEPQFEIPEADMVVLAGDIAPGKNGIKWEKIPDTPVIYLLGNHEYYGQKYSSLLEKLKGQTKNTNITIFENNNIEFIGFE